MLTGKQSGRSVGTSSIVMGLEPVLRPNGVLTLLPSAPAAEEAPALAPNLRLENAFARGSGHGLLSLGADEVGTALPPALSYWRHFGARFVAALCSLPGVSEASGRRAGPGRRRARNDCRGRSADDRRGICHHGGACRSLAGDRSRLRDRAGRIEAHRPGVPQEPQQSLEPRRPRPLQPRREPQGRGGALRVPGDLHDAPVGRGQGRSICRSARPCRNMPARRIASACSRC